MNISSHIDYNLSDPSGTGKDETGVVIRNDDIEENIFDMNDKGLYLYSLQMQKFGDFSSLFPEKIQIDGVDGI